MRSMAFWLLGVDESAADPRWADGRVFAGFPRSGDYSQAAQRLQEITSQVNPMKCPFLSTHHMCPVLEPMFASTTEPRQR